MNILKARKSDLKKLFTNDIFKLYSINKRNLISQTFSKINQKKLIINPIKRTFSYDDPEKSFNNKQDQLTEKVNILSKHKFEVPERYKTMSFTLKILHIQSDLPYVYSFQTYVYQVVHSRNMDQNISLGRGEYFYMNNLLLNLDDYSFTESKNENKILNTIICNDREQLHFLQKVLQSYTNSLFVVIHNYENFIQREANFIIPFNIIIHKEDFIKLVNQFPVDKIFNGKCLFVHYKLNLDKDFKTINQNIRKIKNATNHYLDMNIKSDKSIKNYTFYSAPQVEKNEISFCDFEYNFMIYNESFPESIQKSIQNIFEYLKEESKEILVIINEAKVTKLLKSLLENEINLRKNQNSVRFINKDNLKNIEEDEYNIIIELPFSSSSDFKNHIKFLNKNLNYKFKNQYFCFANAKQIYEIGNLKLGNLYKIRIQNLASNFYFNSFLSVGNPPLHKKIAEYFSSENSNIENKKLELTKRYPNININEVVKYIKGNNELTKKIFMDFIQKRSNLLFKDKDDKYSIINGKKGYFNVKMVPPMKQREDRYFILKFLLKEKLLEENMIEDGLIRVFESFDHIINFHESILGKAFKKCKEQGIQCDIIDELPYIYESPLVNIFKDHTI